MLKNFQNSTKGPVILSSFDKRVEKEKILDLGRELLSKGEITKEQLETSYFKNFLDKSV